MQGTYRFPGGLSFLQATTRADGAGTQMPYRVTDRSEFAKLTAADASDVILRKFAPVESAIEPTEQPRQYKFIFSTCNPDRDNDCVMQEGWKLDAFKSNPVALWAHSHRDFPIGKAVSVGLENGNLVGVIEFATHAMAETVYQLVKGGFLKAVSVGFRALKYALNEERRGIDFMEQELLEISVVPVPANAEALQAASLAGVDLEPMRKWLQDLIIEWPGDLKLKGTAWQKLRLGDEGRMVGEATMKLNVDTSAFDAFTERLEKTLGRANSRARSIVAGDTVRWNKSLSELFDISSAQFAPMSVEQKMVAKYCGCEIKSLRHGHVSIRSPRMGTFLSAFEHMLKGVAVDDVRNLDYRGMEAPPVYEQIQLNSKLSGEFMVDGLRFMRHDGDIKTAIRVEPRWYGLEVTHYAEHKNAGLVNDFMERTFTHMASLKFLKGEAFALSGEFLHRGTESFGDLFLTPKNDAAIKRVAELIDSKGSDLENRGVLLIGPPGTGKTLAGRILMNTTKSTYIWLSARDFYYGGGFNSLDEAFALAQENAPSVLFIEDADSYLNENVTDLLKTTMDGLAKTKGVVTILTSNYPELLPKAIIDRPGRFHDVLRFDLPDEGQRKTMLAKWLPELTGAMLERVVGELAGYSGAHVREFARFVCILREQDSLDTDAAAVSALAKLQEQRDIITSSQAQGSRYRAPAHVTTKDMAHAGQPDYDAGLELADEPQPEVEAGFEVADEFVLEMADEPDGDDSVNVSDAEIRECMREVIGGAMAEMAAAAAKSVMNQMRGRLD